MSTIIIGNGFIANALNAKYKRVPDRVEPSAKSVQDLIDKHRPEAIINCIARTGRPNIDWCETHREETMIANVTVPTLLAEACNRKGIQLVQPGSGCIFYGPSPHAADPHDRDGLGDPGWNEKDFANPRSFYSKTKYACDLAIQDYENVCILRIRMPISKDASRRNYLSKIFSYHKVIDTANSMTFMDDLVRAVDWAIDKRKRGIYHLTYQQPLSAVDFLECYSSHCPSAKYEVINAAQLEKITSAPRSNCLIDSSKILNDGFEMSGTKEERINEYVSAYVNANSSHYPSMDPFEPYVPPFEPFDTRFR